MKPDVRKTNAVVNEALLRLIESGDVEVCIAANGEARYRLTAQGRNRADLQFAKREKSNVKR